MPYPTIRHDRHASVLSWPTCDLHRHASRLIRHSHPAAPFSTLLGLLGLLTLAACSGGDGWAGRVETVDGVVHLHNPDTPLWGEDFVPFSEVEVLGAPGSPVEALFREPLAVEVTADGIRHVLDGRAQRVLRFAPDGTWLGAYGRLGEGPGEFTGACDLALTPDGGILVLEQRRRRISRFTPDGRFLDTVPLEFPYGQITTDARGRLILHILTRTSGGVMIPMNAEVLGQYTLIDQLDGQGVRTGGFGEFREFEGMMLGMWMNRVQPVVTVGDSVVLNYLGEDWIQVWSPRGELARVVHRNIPYQPVEPFEETVQVQEGEGGVASIQIDFELDVLATGFAISPDGQYWAALVALTQTDRRPERAEDEEEIPQEWGIDLFDADGRWLARQELGTDCPRAVLDWAADGLYLIDRIGDATVRRLRMDPYQPER